MSRLQPTISVDVDATNPGQFFACCGLLELASRLDEEALGWFDENRFHITAAAVDVLDRFLSAQIVPVTDDGAVPPSPPIYVKPFRLLLNWWQDDTAVRAGLKTWSGGQTVMGFVEGMQGHVRDHAGGVGDLLTRTFALDKPKPFYFDSRLSRLTAIDMGFSTEHFTASYAPSVELLTLVGLQRFRPITIEPRERYAYHTWNAPLPVKIAAPAAHGLISSSLTLEQFAFPLVVRTGGKYKAFGPSTPDWSRHA